MGLFFLGQETAAAAAADAASNGANGLELYVDSTTKLLTSVNSAGVVNIYNKEAVVTTLSTPMNPTGTTNTTGLMMGLSNTNSALILTPIMTGRIFITICGVVANTTTADGAKWQIRAGTGAAPANAAALTGTAYGSLQQMTFLTGVLSAPFSCTALITGLAVGTAVWLDISLGANTAGTATMTSVAVSAFEV
jgi:hypothetical protein